MKVRVNGHPVELGAAASVAEAVASAGVARPARGVAVAVDGEVVPRAQWEERLLCEGEDVEVVHAVQGG